MSKSKILCIGEAVIDRIYNRGEDINSDAYIDCLGGAPANIAISLNRLGANASFVGRIGNDDGLEKFSNIFSLNNVDTSFMQIDNSNPTRIVKVRRTSDGERSFSGFANNCKNKNKFADIQLKKKQIINTWKQIKFEVNAVVLGSIPLSNEDSRAACFWILDKAKELNIPIFFDINWRSVFWPSYLDSNDNPNKNVIELVKSVISRSSFLKVSNEEALLFFRTNDPEEISQIFKHNIDVVITNGEKDILWYISHHKGKNKLYFPDDIVDTTGAGDAFLSGVIYKLLNNNKNYSHEEIYEIVKFASICGYLTCLKAGAIDSQPTLEEVDLFLRKM